MNCTRCRMRRLLATLAMAIVLLLGAWGLPRRGLGQASGTASGDDLLKTTPFDRLTLVDGTVLTIEPVTPRPLPPYDPKKERAKIKRKEEKDKPPEAGNISLPGEKSKYKSTEAKREEETPSSITIHALEGDERDFRVKRLDIKSIEYFEDMLLAEGERLVRSRQFGKAFEYFLAVHLRDPKWRGLDERVNQLLFEEGVEALRDSDTDHGLRLLRELNARQPGYPDLAERLATAYAGRIDEALHVGAFARGRQILHEIEQLTPDHELVKVARHQFLKRAQALADKAARAEGAEKLDAWIDALRIWPSLDGAAEPYRSAFLALPTLDVAVTDLPHRVAPWVRSPASERAAGLIYVPILADESEEALHGSLPGQLAASVDKANLGRRLELRLRKDVMWSDGSRPVSSFDVVRSLADRTDPRLPCYNARWAELLDKVTAVDEERIEIQLTRAFLRPEYWFVRPIGPAHAAWDGWVTTTKGRLPVGDGPFQWESSTKEMVRYLATSPAGEASPGTPRVRRIREVRYPDSAQALAALIRGDVTLIDHVPADHLAALAKNSELKIGRYGQPKLHQIAIDGRNPALRNRTLRRGISYAIDRKTLLEETLLKRGADDQNAVSDGPFPKGSYADAPAVKPLGYDPLLAKMLVAAARKEMGGGPIKLKFAYPAIPEAQAVAPRIAEALRKIDLEIDLVERPESDLEEELRSGRRFDLAYRALTCAEPVTDVGPILCPGYDAAPNTNALESVPSPRSLELLLRLERASEMPSANGLVVMLDRESRDELPILPLWQLEDHYAWRTRLKGPADTADRLYQGLESWEIEPWFAKDPW